MILIIHLFKIFLSISHEVAKDVEIQKILELMLLPNFIDEINDYLILNKLVFFSSEITIHLKINYKNIMIY